MCDKTNLNYFGYCIKCTIDEKIKFNIELSNTRTSF